MSLSKQLIILVTFLFVLVFAGTMVISIHTTRGYLEEQMASHAQDTATSLGLSITHAVQKKDLPFMNSMIDAVFDRGYYRDLVLNDVDGNAIISRTLSVKLETVPEWFVNLIPLETPEGRAVIMSGWAQLGEIIAHSHPGYAYNKLWETSVSTFWWFVGASVVIAIFITISIKLALSPLHAIEKVARSISEREFPIIRVLPWTRELRQVVLAINKMSGNLKKIISDHVDLADRLRFEAYHDPVTCLYNRDSFMERLSYLLEQEEHERPSAILLVAIKGFPEYNDQYGHMQGDELLRQAAAIISTIIISHPRHIAARLSGAEFSVFVQDISLDETKEMSETLLAALRDISINDIQPSTVSINIGMTYSETKKSSKDFMAEADMSLRAAQSKGPDSIVLHDTVKITHNIVKGAMEWRHTLLKILDSDGIKLVFQPVIYAQNNGVMQYEVLARLLNEDNEYVPASTFFPMAERSGISTDIDKAVIRKAIEYVSTSDSDDKYAVNISATSFKSDKFINWLIDQTNTDSDIRDKLIFEVSEYGVISDIDKLKSVVNLLRSNGISCSIDNFGVSTGSFGYLKNLKIDYLKLDGSYIKNLPASKDNQFFVQTIVQIAHGLDITVIAKSVETSEQAFLLNELKVDGLQGYHIGRPGKK